MKKGGSGGERPSNAVWYGQQGLMMKGGVDMLEKSMGAKLNFALRASQWWPGEVR